MRNRQQKKWPGTSSAATSGDTLPSTDFARPPAAAETPRAALEAPQPTPFDNTTKLQVALVMGMGMAQEQPAQEQREPMSIFQARAIAGAVFPYSQSDKAVELIRDVEAHHKIGGAK